MPAAPLIGKQHWLNTKEIEYLQAILDNIKGVGLKIEGVLKIGGAANKEKDITLLGGAVFTR